MGCSSSKDDFEGKRVNDEIETQLKKDKANLRNEVKMLLLGAGESGKSTIIKQMKLIHGNGYTLEEKESYKEIIFSNTIQSIRVLLEAMENMEIPLDNPGNEKYVNLILDYPPQIEADVFPSDSAEAVKMLWHDKGVQECFSRSNEFQLNDSAKYYFDSIDRLSQPGYIPTDQDVLRSRVKTTGINETVFNVGELTYRMLDVGGQRSERKKWIHCFENVTAILFLVAISEYDQVLIEDETVNRMQEALTLFDSICNSRWFAKTSIILFLNKMDLFKAKLPKSPLKDYFPGYTGENDVDSAGEYILRRFVSLNQSDTKQIYTHFTCATDTNQIKFALYNPNTKEKAISPYHLVKNMVFLVAINLISLNKCLESMSQPKNSDNKEETKSENNELQVDSDNGFVGYVEPGKSPNNKDSIQKSNPISQKKIDEPIKRNFLKIRLFYKERDPGLISHRNNIPITRHRKQNVYVEINRNKNPGLSNPKHDQNTNNPTNANEVSYLRKRKAIEKVQRPRWYNQTYILFLALRQCKNYTASRKDLLEKAVKLDKKMSKELGIPKVYTGKTPLNSASAILTRNMDLLFIQKKPENSKHFVFTLAYKPGDFQSALENYNSWMKTLVEVDWPKCFGQDEYKQVSSYETQMTDIITEKHEQAPDQSEKSIESINTDHAQHTIDNPTDSSVMDLYKSKNEHDTPENENNSQNKQNEENEPNTKKTSISGCNHLEAESYDNMSELSLNSNLDSPKTNNVNIDTPFTDEKTDIDIPKKWEDIVEVRKSTIPNAGDGLFAKRFLPAGIPLGFYFGVPMTEDEFDSLKDRVGLASSYSIMYRKTVLDGTDENGMPYTDLNGPVFCPFHFMNDDREDLNSNVTFVEGRFVNQVIVFTIRNIMPNEELFVYYGSEVDRGSWGKDETTK
ncbi:hypothetical protein BB559_004694 [Furculomyces boomerangus]|uniref:SET domain-containing protein n=2 Tax=Harpellales TaxID=61421 RepID=A0A2T9YDC1_9FUNG|nr:hypothetical protein BB559_004694 [Furculomyces boomerangus]PWA03055.1 hypothetical protein BB558_000788 [Smittium angustum]